MWDPGHLGHLIFGDHASVVAPPGWQEADEPDPLTLEFFPHKGSILSLVLAVRVLASSRALCPQQERMLSLLLARHLSLYSVFLMNGFLVHVRLDPLLLSLPCALS